MWYIGVPVRIDLEKIEAFGVSQQQLKMVLVLAELEERKQYPTFRSFQRLVKVRTPAAWHRAMLRAKWRGLLVTERQGPRWIVKLTAKGRMIVNGRGNESGAETAA